MVAKDMSREEWLALRAQSLGSSEAASAIGEDEYLSPLELWERKLGLVETPDISGLRRIRLGHKLEPIVLEEYAHERAVRLLTERREIEAVLTSETCEVVGWVEGRQPMIRDRNRPWRTATLDGLAVDAGGVPILVEAKAPGYRQLRKWPEDGAKAPDSYRIQVWHTLGIANHIPSGVLVALVGGAEYRDIEINTSTVPHGPLIALEQEFMNAVTTKEPPRRTGKAIESHIRAIERLHPDDSGEVVVLTTPVLDLHREIEALEAQIKAGKDADARKKELREAIEVAMGSATFGELPNGGGTYSLRWNDRAGYEVKASRFRTLKFTKGAK